MSNTIDCIKKYFKKTLKFNEIFRFRIYDLVMEEIKILIVEDDELLATTLAKTLQKDYEIKTVNSASDGWQAFQKEKYEIALIDIILPDTDNKTGLDLCKKFREKDGDIRILMITGKKSINFKLGAFKYGADDYLCKPFNVLELRARIKALLKRNTHNNTGIYTYKDLQVDDTARTVRRNKQKVHLRNKEFEILKLLISNPTKVLTRELIMELALNKYDITSNCIDVHIRHIRQKLEEPFGSQIIKTVHGIGYKLE